MNITEAQWLGNLKADQMVFVLIHSLWQAAACAALLWVALRMISAHWPTVRYGTAIGAMCLLIASMITTWSLLDQHQTRDAMLLAERMSPVEKTSLTEKAADRDSVVERASTHNGRGDVLDNSTHGHSESRSAHSAIVTGEELSTTESPWTRWVALAWLAGTMLMLVRLAWVVANAHGLVRCSRPLENDELTAIVDRLKKQFGIARRVRVLVCERINVPAVLGIVWPVLLIPPSLLTGIPAGQMRIVLAHELAHIRRYDYLVNLLQMLVESVLFFNPAVWWLSRQIRIEREACCDALAVTATGQPMDVAHALVDFADRLGTGKLRPQPLVQSFADVSEPGSLFGRVKRIVLPDQNPHIRLPWHSLVGITLLCTLMIYGLERGTHTAVVAAAEWLTPPEHVRKLVELRKTHSAPRSDQPLSEDEKVHLVVRVRTADGSPVPKETHVSATTRRPRASIGYSLNKNGPQQFEARVQPGRITIRVTSKGFAPCRSGPIVGKTGEKLEAVELVLEPGFTSRIRVIDTEGNPVPQAKIKGGFVQERDQLDSRNSRADEDGLVVLEHCPKLAFRMDVDARGFQFERRTVVVVADKTVDYVVHRGTPTVAQVVSAKTGKPIPRAAIELAGQFGNSEFQRTYEPYASYRQPPRLAQTDDTGHCTLNRLRDDCDYALLVSAEGYGPQLIQPVRAGQKNLMVSLGPARSILGKILGPLDKLDKHRQGKDTYRVVHFGSSVKIGDGNYSYGRRAKVDIRDGVGHFLISDLLPGKVTVRVAGRSMTLDPQPSIDDLTIDLSKPERPDGADVEKRTVVFRIRVPDGAAEPRGELRVDYIRPEHPNGYFPDWRPVHNSEARIEVPVPTRVRYETGRLIGYWVEEKSNIEVTKGDEPLIVDIPAMPAGAIYGQVLNPDGSPCKQFNLSVIVIEKPAHWRDKPLHLDMVRNEGEAGKYIASPLPIGGRYRLVASHARVGSGARVISKEVHITPDNAIQEMDTQFVEGVTVSGRVVGPDGEPVTGTAIALHWSSPYSHGFGGASQKTDRSGLFRFNHVNAGLPGKFRLKINPTKSFQGRGLELSPSTKPITVKLREGARVSGILLDDATGWPIANATIQVYPKVPADADFLGEVTTRTDAKGQFVFSNLQKISYRLRIDGAVHPDVEIEKLPDGRVRYHYHGDHDWEIAGSQSKPATLRAKLKPSTHLKPTRPN